MQWLPKNDVRMGDSGVHSMSMSSDGGSQRNSKSMGKIINKIDDSEFKMCKMTMSDERPKEPPYKPQVAPPDVGRPSNKAVRSQKQEFL